MSVMAAQLHNLLIACDGFILRHLNTKQRSKVKCPLKYRSSVVIRNMHDFFFIHVINSLMKIFFK